MNRVTSSCLIAILALPLVGQEMAPINQKLHDLIMISTIDPKLKPLPSERWKTALLPPLPVYPGLSQIAGIEGELLMHCKINQAGKVTETKLISGPPQLASTLDKWVRHIEFRVLPEDGAGPWHYSVSAKFSLPNRIQIFPSAIKLFPSPFAQGKAKN